MSRMPGLAIFANIRGLLGSVTEDTQLRAESLSAAVLADDTAADIPLAGIEGRLVADLCASTGAQVEYPSSYPLNRDPVGYLHVSSHGVRETRLLGSRRSSILMGRVPIDEGDVIAAPLAKEAFINVCIGGQCHDSPLDGNPTGLVSGFLRRGSHWVGASLLSIPDDWACLFGLIVADLKFSLDCSLPEALDRAREMLVDGGWSTRVSEAFSKALVESSGKRRPLPEFGNQMMGGSLIDELTEVLLQISETKGRMKTTAFEGISSRSAFWWLAGRLPLFEAMVANPQNLPSLTAQGITDAVRRAALSGPPKLVDLDTVRYGVTLLGDPKYLLEPDRKLVE